MHELAVMQNIMRICIGKMKEAKKKKVTKISLRVGEMRNIEEDWMQKYFGYISPGTPAEGAVIRITKVPVKFHCEDCDCIYHPDPMLHTTYPCPKCGGDHYDIVTGGELLIESIEIE